MAAVLNTFIEKRYDWLIALFEHFYISVVALLAALVIALPLAVMLSRYKKPAEFFLHITGILQTIPSLALLGLLIPVFGIGRVPAVITLTLYAMFPILQNTITGLHAIDPSLEEAATAFGMTKWEKLKKFELALAMPVIISGVRTSAVMIIGTATLAALIGAGGLGSFILLGIDRNNTALIIIGAVSSAALAVAFNFSIKFLERCKLKTIGFVLLSAIVLMSGSFLKLHPVKEEKIVIAGKLGAEPDIIINMYKALIEHHTDLSVELKPNFGKTTFLYQALKSGDIDVYPEFTGTVTASLLKNPPPVSTDADQVYEAARSGILAQDNLVLLQPMHFHNTYAVAIKKDYAEQYGLECISDLAKVERTAIAGFTLEFNDRDDGTRGLKHRYGLNLNVKTMEPALRYQALEAGSVQIIDAYSTDSDIKRYGLTVLRDDKQLFPPYQGAPLLRRETLKRYPQLKAVLETLSGQITAEEMSAMNYKVDVHGKPAAAVAHEYLVRKGLLE